ncbi:MAG: porin, partial [Methylovirgula sp.]
MPKLKSKLRSGGRHAKFAVLAAAAAALVASSFVAVSSARADTTDVLLEQLKAKGILTKKEYNKLKARHAAEKAHYHYAGPPAGMIVKGPAPEYVTVCPKHICMRVGQVDVSLSGDLVMFGTESFASSASGSAAVGGV